MSIEHPRHRVFYGWWVALTAALGLLLNTATIVVFTFGIFAKAIGSEFHSGRAAGRLVDRLGVRRVLLPFTALFALILISGSFISNAIWELYVFYVVLGAVSGGAGAMPYTSVVSEWFDRHRGLALSVMMLGMGMGAIVMPSIAQRLVATFGWRHSCAIFGLAVLLVPLPVVAAFLKEKPESMGFLPDGSEQTHTATRVTARAEGLAVREACRTREFWTLAGALFRSRLPVSPRSWLAWE
jgi:MFS family permease